MFFYRQGFTAQAGITVHHKFGVVPDVVSVHNGGKAIGVSSVTRTETKCVVTLEQQATGKVTVEVSKDRIGHIRKSPDGTEWALFVTDDGLIRAVKVPTQIEDLADPAQELAARIAARVEEMRQALISMSTRHYEPHHQRKLTDLKHGAKADGLLNRLAYVDNAVDWLDSLFNYYATKATEMSLATSFAALDAITWDLGLYDQSYDVVLAPQGDPEVSIITAMGILD